MRHFSLPATYADWVRCITVTCGLELTPAFVAARLEALGDPANHETRRFVEQWGEAHRQKVLGWLEHARKELLAVTPATSFRNWSLSP